MKNNIAKILGVVLTVVTLASVFVIAAPTSAAPAAQAWSKYGVPSTTGMVLNTTITVGGPIAQSSDAKVLYAFVNDGGVLKIIQSTDNGRTWQNKVASGAPLTAVLEIVCSPTEANVVFYITATTMYMSTDSGVNFSAVLSAPVGAALTSFDVAKWGTPSRYIAVVGTNEATTDTLAGVYYWDQSLPFNNLTPVGTSTFSGWQSTIAGTILNVRMSPTFATDRTVVAVGVDTATNTTMIRMDVNGGAWGAIVPDLAAAIATTGPIAADIAFPSDFNYATSPIYFVCIDDAAQGGIYRIIGNVPTSVNATRTFTNMSYNGSFASATATVLAGTTAGTAYKSSNSGNTFSAITLRSSVAATAWVLLDRNYATSKLAWILNVGTAGNPQGALNVTTDGSTYNQWSLIGDAITGIRDMAVAPNGDVIIITTNGGTTTSVYRNLVSAGTPWERVYWNVAATYNKLTLAADYATGKDLAIWSSGIVPTGTGIAISTNSMNSFSAMTSLPGTIVGAANPVSSFALYVINATTVVVGDNTGTIVTNQTSTGITSAYWWNEVTNGPFGAGYTVNQIVNAGGTNLLAVAVNATAVKVAKSADNGVTWTVLPAVGSNVDSILTVTSGPAFVAPADDYATTGAVYVAATPGIWMYPSTAVGNLNGWLRVDVASTAVGTTGTSVATASGLVTAAAANTSAEGTGMIYATDNSVATNVARVRGHMAFAEKLVPLTGITDVFSGLWAGPVAAGSIQLWTLDVTTPNIWNYVDTLAVQGTGVTVSNLTTSQNLLFGLIPAITTATVSWTALTNATSYDVAINTTLQSNLYTATTSAGVTFVALSPTAIAISGMTPGMTYFVSIWAAAPVSSFMFGTTVAAPLPAVGPAIPLVPTLGAEDVDLQPSFVAWGSVPGATSYSLQLTLATDSAYAAPIANVTNIAAPAGQPTITYNWNGAALTNNTSYIWRVAANLTGGTFSGWVNGNFRTEKVVTPPVTVSITTQPQATIIFPSQQPAVTVTVNPPAPTPVLTVTQPIITLTTPPAGPTPSYIWIIVGVGAVLTIAVIVLIIRTRRVV